MPTRKRARPKKSKPQKSTSSRLKKAVPPPDNPLLRHQADEVALEGEDTSQKEMAKLRAKAWEQTRRMTSPDSTDTVNKT
jgi:hypothetical protein